VSRRQRQVRCAMRLIGNRRRITAGSAGGIRASGRQITAVVTTGGRSVVHARSAQGLHGVEVAQCENNFSCEFVT